MTARPTFICGVRCMMTTNSNIDVQNRDAMYNPILQVVKKLGGSATTSEIERDIIGEMGFDDRILEPTYPDGKPQFLKAVGFVRLQLTRSGYLENVAETARKGVWALTEEGATTETVDPKEVQRRYRAVERQKRRGRESATTREGSSNLTDLDDGATDTPADDDSAWRQQLMEMLLNMDPSAFERLCQRVLRESGFAEVNVTVQSGDGGIDGNGILLIQDIISIPVAFQSKRYQGSVGAPEVQKLRGSLSRPGERGLLITTGTFTPQARRVAQEGASVIDLIDGDALLEKLKERKLGVKVEMVEQTTVETGWWESNYGVTISDTVS